MFLLRRWQHHTACVKCFCLHSGPFYACEGYHMTLFTFDGHNLDISTDRKKDGVGYEIYQLWLRRIQCRYRILIFHLKTTKASVSLKIGGSGAESLCAVTRLNLKILQVMSKNHRDTACDYDNNRADCVRENCIFEIARASGFTRIFKF